MALEEEIGENQKEEEIGEKPKEEEKRFCEEGWNMITIKKIIVFYPENKNKSFLLKCKEKKKEQLI